MNFARPSRHLPFLAPKHLNACGLASPKPSGVGGFTLIEIMIVVSIVTILSWLAMIAIGRVQDRAARSLIANNLRQLYQAKEYYFSETGVPDTVKFVELDKSGYIRKSIVSHIFHNDSLELKRGWRYNLEYKSGEPIYARRYANANGTGGITETIWYPAPPEGAVAQSGSGVNPQTSPTLIPKPPVVVQQPPAVVQPPVVVAQPPVTTTGGPDINQPPAVIAQPPVTTTVNPAVNQGPAATQAGPANQQPGNQPNNNHSPGNSAHGHAQGHGNNKP